MSMETLMMFIFITDLYSDSSRGVVFSTTKMVSQNYNTTIAVVMNIYSLQEYALSKLFSTNNLTGLQSIRFTFCKQKQ